MTVSGRPETYRYTDSNGQERILHRFVVETFRFKSLQAPKRRAEGSLRHGAPRPADGGRPPAGSAHLRPQCFLQHMILIDSARAALSLRPLSRNLRGSSSSRSVHEWAPAGGSDGAQRSSVWPSENNDHFSLHCGLHLDGLPLARGPTEGKGRSVPPRLRRDPEDRCWIIPGPGTCADWRCCDRLGASGQPCQAAARGWRPDQVCPRLAGVRGRAGATWTDPSHDPAPRPRAERRGTPRSLGYRNSALAADPCS